MSRPFLQRRVSSPFELPRNPEPEDGPPVYPAQPYSPEAKAAQRATAAGLRWHVGVDHRGAFATVDGHTVRARASCAEVLNMAIDKALTQRAAA